MRSNKSIARKANRLVTVFMVENADCGPQLQRVLDYAKKALDERQIAPQTIMEKVVAYALNHEGIIRISGPTYNTLKEMEKLSRVKSWLPFRPYDPW